MSYDPGPGQDPGPPRQGPPPSTSRALRIVATVVAVVAGVTGLLVVGFFILMFIALNSWGNTK